MLRKVDARTMGKGDHGWLKSHFHFSFADYYRPDNMHFGVLRVMNDDLIASQTGFELHPHKDMEIVSYVIEGTLTHGDTMGNQRTLSRGQFQYMSAGTGVFHSEHNLGDQTGRFLQIWILPDQKGHTPQYGDFPIDWDVRENQWYHSVSKIGGGAPIQIHQDVNFYVGSFDANSTVNLNVEADRQVYLVQIEGSSDVYDIELNERDALEVVGESIVIKTKTQSHFLYIEMKKTL